MRGDDRKQQALFSYVSPEARIPRDHPLRPIRKMVDSALKDLSPLLEEMYSHTGRPSIAPSSFYEPFCFKSCIPFVANGCW